ncbi:MAG: hypothetical protein D6732_16495 [Methanobacteriota archaeon]|nr:MAG: hypothetical protein D6732_16495 [Euryarchaeota archaeon]
MSDDTSAMKKLHALSEAVKKEMSPDSSLGRMTDALGKEASKIARKTKNAVKETAEFAKNRITGKKGVPVELLLFLL